MDVDKSFLFFFGRFSNRVAKREGGFSTFPEDYSVDPQIGGAEGEEP